MPTIADRWGCPNFSEAAAAEAEADTCFATDHDIPRELDELTPIRSCNQVSAVVIRYRTKALMHVYGGVNSTEDRH